MGQISRKLRKLDRGTRTLQVRLYGQGLEKFLGGLRSQPALGTAEAYWKARWFRIARTASLNLRPHRSDPQGPGHVRAGEPLVVVQGQRPPPDREGVQDLPSQS